MVTQNDYNELILNLEKLRTGISVLDNKRADLALLGLVNNSLNTVKKLETNFQESPTMQLSGCDGSEAAPDQPVRAGDMQKTPNRIVLHKMDFWEWRDLGVHGNKLYNSIFIEHHFKWDVDTFELTQFRVEETVACIRYATPLLLRKSKLNVQLSAIKGAVYGFWFKIMQAPHSAGRHKALMDFFGFVDRVNAKIDAAEESTIDGVKIFNLS